MKIHNLKYQFPLSLLRLHPYNLTLCKSRIIGLLKSSIFLLSVLTSPDDTHKIAWICSTLCISILRAGNDALLMTHPKIKIPLLAMISVKCGIQNPQVALAILCQGIYYDDRSHLFQGLSFIKQKGRLFPSE